MYPKELMTVEQVIRYFSATYEFTVTNAGENLKISYTDDSKTTSMLIWKEHLTIQQLIRTVQNLVWNHCNNILDT
jgi:hypothetical protein